MAPSLVSPEQASHASHERSDIFDSAYAQPRPEGLTDMLVRQYGFGTSRIALELQEHWSILRLSNTQLLIQLQSPKDIRSCRMGPSRAGP